MLRDIHPGPQVVIDFRSIFDHNLDPPNLIFRAPAAGRARFIKKSFAAIGTDFGSILIANSFHFPFQNRLKPFQKSIPRQINFLIDFWIDFLLIWDRFWKPTWSQVGHIFLQDGGTLWHASPFFVGSMLLFGFLLVLDPSWLSLGSILEGLSLDFGGFWDPFWRFLVMIWVPCALQF